MKIKCLKCGKNDAVQMTDREYIKCSKMPKCNIDGIDIRSLIVAGITKPLKCKSCGAIESYYTAMEKKLFHMEPLPEGGFGNGKRK